MRGLFALVAAIGLFSLGIQPAAAEETMRYGVQPTMSPVYIALALGLFYPVEEKDHIRFLFVPYQNGPAANKAIASGDLQMSSEDMGSALVAASRHAGRHRRLRKNRQRRDREQRFSRAASRRGARCRARAIASLGLHHKGPEYGGQTMGKADRTS